MQEALAVEQLLVLLYYMSQPSCCICAVFPLIFESFFTSLNEGMSSVCVPVHHAASVITFVLRGQ